MSLEDRQDFILKIASGIICSKGYQNASLQDIARAAGMTKAGIYHYFKTKEQILARIIMRNTDVFLDNLEKQIRLNKEKNLSPEESFFVLIKVYARHVNRDYDRRQIILRDRHQLSGRYRHMLLKREQSIFNLLRYELHKIPNLNKKLNMNVIGFLFISMSHWLGYWYKEKKGLNLEEIITQNIEIIMNGIIMKDSDGKKVQSSH